MKQSTRLVTVGTTVMAATLKSLALSGPALAAKATHAGPPTTERIPLTQGAPTFLCEGRRITVTGGEFVDRLRKLPHERFKGVFVAHGGVGVDQRGNAYKIRVTGRFMSSETAARSRLNVVLIGRGEVYRVQFRFSAAGEGATQTVTGDCTVV